MTSTTTTVEASASMRASLIPLRGELVAEPPADATADVEREAEAGVAHVPLEGVRCVALPARALDPCEPFRVRRRARASPVGGN